MTLLLLQLLEPPRFNDLARLSYLVEALRGSREGLVDKAMLPAICSARVQRLWAGEQTAQRRQRLEQIMLSIGMLNSNLNCFHADNDQLDRLHQDLFQTWLILNRICLIYRGVYVLLFMRKSRFTYPVLSKERVTYDKDVQTTEMAIEVAAPNEEEENRVRNQREKESEEDLSKDHHEEDEYSKIIKQLDDELRGMYQATIL